MSDASDVDLRALVRDAVARHMSGGAGARSSAPQAPAAPSGLAPHPSHGVYITLINAGDACVIEPNVPCTHCEYCRSHGY